MIEVTVRAYGSLNDFLSPRRRQVSCRHVVDGHPTVKDLVEGFGVPHSEVDLILVNGLSVPFEHIVQDGDRIAVFPRFFTFEIESLTRVRSSTPDVIRFVADVHLGTLARRLRLLGLDTAYRADAHDRELADLAALESRILLTRDVGLLKRRVVTHGYYVRATHPHDQLVEVLRRFVPLALCPFSRCVRCNAELREVSKTAVDATLNSGTRQCYDTFQACTNCGQVYWKGSHWTRLTQAIDAALKDAGVA